MLSLTCAIVSSENLAHYGVFCAKDWVYVECGTRSINAFHISTIFTKGNIFVTTLQNLLRLQEHQVPVFGVYDSS